MTFRITILCENTVGPISGTLGERGFAALIEPAGNEPLLFDTGQGMTLLHNAQRMKKKSGVLKHTLTSATPWLILPEGWRSASTFPWQGRTCLRFQQRQRTAP